MIAKDRGDVIFATDAAGNITQIILQQKDRKSAMRADVAAISYNGLVADTGRAAFQFDWSFSTGGILKTLNQKVWSRENFSISASYSLGNTTIVGKDQSGKINRRLSGLYLLKVSTDKGNYFWSY